MSATDELTTFVRDSLASGRTRAQIADVLAKAGWAPEHVRGALGNFADVEFAIPVPRPRPYLSAREAFLYLVLFTTLYVSAYSFGALLFQFINLGFPDAARTRNTEWVYRAIRFSVAALIVAFPVFMSMTRVTVREIVRDPRKRASVIRRWLTYLTLFIAVGVLIGDFIGLLYNFLGGDLTTRFTLKSLTVGVIAGTILGHYLRDLRHEERDEPTVTA